MTGCPLGAAGAPWDVPDPPPTGHGIQGSTEEPFSRGWSLARLNRVPGHPSPSTNTGPGPEGVLLSRALPSVTNRHPPGLPSQWGAGRCRAWGWRRASGGSGLSLHPAGALVSESGTPPGPQLPPGPETARLSCPPLGSRLSSPPRPLSEGGIVRAEKAGLSRQPSPERCVEHGESTGLCPRHGRWGRPGGLLPTGRGAQSHRPEPPDAPREDLGGGRNTHRGRPSGTPRGKVTDSGEDAGGGGGGGKERVAGRQRGPDTEDLQLPRAGAEPRSTVTPALVGKGPALPSSRGTAASASPRGPCSLEEGQHLSVLSTRRARAGRDKWVQQELRPVPPASTRQPRLLSVTQDTGRGGRLGL